MTIDDKNDSSANMGVLSSTQLAGIFGAGGVLNYSNLEDLQIALGNAGTAGNTFTIVSTHGTTGHVATTELATGSGNDRVNVDSISGLTSIDTQAGDDLVRVGSTVSPALTGDPVDSVLDNISVAWLMLQGGAGAERPAHLRRRPRRSATPACSPRRPSPVSG